MTNKTLVIIIIAIIVVGIGAGAYFYWQQTKPLVVSTDNFQNSQTTPPADAFGQSANPTASGTPVQTPPKTADECTNQFSPAKLTKNTNLNISNRQAEIDVKGFGKIDLEFYDKDAPKAVENFLRLTDAGYYDCVTFHRVAKGFVIQGGDPTGTGAGGQSAFGSAFADELKSTTASYKTGYVKGVLAMANAGPGTNGSQFFILLGDAPSLPHSYTIFGKVTAGQDVVDKIGQVAINPPGASDGSPVTPVIMQSVKITK